MTRGTVYAMSACALCFAFGMTIALLIVLDGKNDAQDQLAAVQVTSDCRSEVAGDYRAAQGRYQIAEGGDDELELEILDGAGRDPVAYETLRAKIPGIEARIKTATEAFMVEINRSDNVNVYCPSPKMDRPIDTEPTTTTTSAPE